MMKKIFLSFISLVISVSLAVGVVAQAEDPSASEIYGNTIFRPEYRSNTFAEGVFAGMVSDFITACLDDLSEAYVNNNRAPNVQSAYLSVDANNYRIQNITMPSFGYLGGKTRLLYKRTLQQNEPYWVDVTIDIFYCGGYDYGFTPWLQWSDGVKIPVNSLIYTITRMDGTSNRYFLRLNANSLSSPWGISFSQSSDVDYFTLPETSYSTTVYMIDGDEQYHQAFTYTPREKRVYFHDTNDVKFGLPRNGYPSPITLRTPALDYTPSDREIINGYISYYPTGQDSYYYNTDFDFYVTYYSTNDQSTAQWLSSSALTAPFEQNYYYNDVFKTGDVINNNNVENKYLGAFAPIFDVDLSDVDLNTLIPSITTAITPTLQLGIDSLFDSLLDFFGNMPDIGNQWDLTLDNNNYFDIIPLDPDDPGGGQVWDPPKYPAVNTSVYIPAEIPTYSTYAAVTIPSTYIEGTGDWFYFGYNLFDDLGLLVFVIPLAILSIFWRFTGGD